MSDGNYNRNLLPYRKYQSGVRAGRAQAKQWALQAFMAWLDAERSALSADEKERTLIAFKQQLDAALNIP